VIIFVFSVIVLGLFKMVVFHTLMMIMVLSLVEEPLTLLISKMPLHMDRRLDQVLHHLITLIIFTFGGATGQVVIGLLVIQMHALSAILPIMPRRTMTPTLYIRLLLEDPIIPVVVNKGRGTYGEMKLGVMQGTK
jgi:hypothetical protein